MRYPLDMTVEDIEQFEFEWNRLRDLEDPELALIIRVNQECQEIAEEIRSGEVENLIF